MFPSKLSSGISTNASTNISFKFVGDRRNTAKTENAIDEENIIEEETKGEIAEEGTLKSYTTKKTK